MELEYKFEKFEEYYGDALQVKKIIEDCKICGTKMVHTHMSDYKNMIMHESSRCPDCGQGNRKVIHIIN